MQDGPFNEKKGFTCMSGRKRLSHQLQLNRSDTIAHEPKRTAQIMPTLGWTVTSATTKNPQESS